MSSIDDSSFRQPLIGADRQQLPQNMGAGRGSSRMSEKRFLFTTLCGAILTSIVTALAIFCVGFAFTEPCTSPQGKAIGYTGCFSPRQWLLSVLVVIVAFTCCGFLEISALSAMCVAQEKGGRLTATFALSTLFALTVAATLLAFFLLAKPWATYQTYPDGRTKSGSEWTIDVWLVFLGYCIVFVGGPFSVSLAIALSNLRKSAERRTGYDDVEGDSSSDASSTESDDSCAKQRTVKANVPVATTLILSLCFLLTCFIVTTFGTPMWNFSMNSYFKSVSKHALAYIPIGILPCSLVASGSDSCAGSCPDITYFLTYFQPGVDPCPWFSFKPFPDAVLYYGFLAGCILAGAAAHNLKCKWAWRVLKPFRALPAWLNPFPSGLTVLEAIAVLATACFFILWFCFWHWGYGRFQERDIVHDCWTSDARQPSDQLGPKGTPGVAVSTDGIQLTCDQIPGSVPTGNAELHILCRVSGHMASLAFSLTLLPTTKTSILMRATGLSYEKVMHWHRGLGAVAYVTVTLHMLLWWLKWILEGTFVRNLLVIDQQKWLWVTPSWVHYENFSVMMAQVSWIFFTAVIMIAWTGRRKMYRLFYLSHQFALFFLFIGVMHAWSFWFFAIPGLTLWWLDRLHRLVMASEATVVTAFNAVPGTDVTQVELCAPGFASRFAPGQFGLINVPSVEKTSWHPFTVNVIGDKVTFLCKTEGTWTTQLRKLASESSALPVALLAGPYGGIDPQNYSTALVFLAAGGIGITPVISVFSDCMKRRLSGVTLLWVIRSFDYLHLPVVKEVLADAASHSNVDVIIHATKARHDEIPCPPASNVQYEAGRPNIEALINNAVEKFGSADDGFGFACGPGPLTEDVLRVCEDAGFRKQHAEIFLF